MVPKAAQPSVGLKLPVGVVGQGDLRRLGRELEQLEDNLRQMRLQTNAPIAKLPRLSRALEAFAATNRLNLLLPDDRQRSGTFIAFTLRSAPVLHMSFAAEASRAFTTEIVLWLRGNIALDVLLEVGLEPNIAAGCMLRTPSKQYDFSLRARFEKQSELLLSKLRLAQPTKAADTVVAAPSEAAHVG